MLASVIRGPSSTGALKLCGFDISSTWLVPEDQSESITNISDNLVPAIACMWPSDGHMTIVDSVGEVPVSSLLAHTKVSVQNLSL